MNEYKVNLVLNMLSYAVQKNVSPEQLCRMSGVDIHLIKKRAVADISDKQFNDLWLNASHLSKDPLFGLHFGESLQLAALGLVGGVIQYSQTIGEAITHGASFIPLLTDMFEMKIEKSSRSFIVSLIPILEGEGEYPFVLRQMMELILVLTLHEVNGLVLEKLKPQRVKLPYKIAELQEYERVFRCKPVKADGECSLMFESRWWEVPIITANYELQKILLENAGGITGKMKKQSTKERVKNYLQGNSFLGIPALEEIAFNFNTSSRSLQRKLREEGTTYQEVADTVRKSLAMHYLKSGSPIKEISYMLGYNELSAFTRAFKRWTGTTPGSYQKK